MLLVTAARPPALAVTIGAKLKIVVRRCGGLDAGG
jgi:hypothetical protein